MNIKNEEGISRFLHTVDGQKGITVGDPILSIGDIYMVIERGDFRLSKDMVEALTMMAEEPANPRMVRI